MHVKIFDSNLSNICVHGLAHCLVARERLLNPTESFCNQTILFVGTSTNKDFQDDLNWFVLVLLLYTYFVNEIYIRNNERDSKNG